MLAEIAVEEAAEGEILVEIGPMEAERGQFDAVELGGSAAGEARVFRDGETEFDAALHSDDDLAVEVKGADGGVSQGVHAIFGG